METLMSDIQKALDRQAKLEAEATPAPWGVKTCTCECCAYFTPKDIMYAINGLAMMPPSDALLIAHLLIAHLRNAAPYMRAVIEAAAEIGEASRISETPEMRQQRLYKLMDANKAWADYVNEETP